MIFIRTACHPWKLIVSSCLDSYLSSVGGQIIRWYTDSVISSRFAITMEKNRIDINAEINEMSEIA